MKQKYNKTLVNGGLFSVYSFIGKGFSFFLLILLANYMPPSDYGRLSLFNTVVSFVMVFVTLSTNGYISISYFKKSKNDFKKDFAVVFSIGGIMFLFFMLIIVIFGDGLSVVLNLTNELIIIAVIIAFMSVLFRIQQDIFRIREEVVKYGIYNIGNAFLNFGLSLAFVISLQQGWMGRVNAHLACSIIFAILALITFRNLDLFRFDWDWNRYKVILLWGLPMIPHLATGWIKQGLDRYIINYSYTTIEVGLFSYALNVTNIIIMLGTAFNSTNSVTLFQILSNDKLDNFQKRRGLLRQTRLIGVIYFVTSILVAVLLSLITLFFLPKYSGSLPFLLVLSINGFLQCVYFLYCNYLFYYSKTKNLMFITFGTSVFHLLLSLCLTPFSLYFTAFIYVITTSTIVVLVIYQAKKLIKANLKMNL